MKRILTLILVLALALATFTACDLFNKQPDNGGEQGGENTGNEGENGGENGGNEGEGENQQPETDEGLQAAYDYIHQLYKTLKNTAGDFEVVKTVAVGDTTYTVTWAVDVEDVEKTITITEKELEDEDGNKHTVYLVDVPKQEIGDAAIAYKLTFTVANAAGETLSRTYSLVVPEGRVNTFAEYAAAEEGEALTVDGIVIGIYSNSAGDKENSIFLQDLNNEGGYYAYQLATDPAGTIQVGMTLRVKGDKALYNGTYELKNCAIEILDSTIKTVEPVDLTEAFINAQNTSAAELAGKQGMLATVKGVTIKNAGSNGYYNWTLAGKNSYLRISSSSNATTADQEATIKSLFAANFYNKADVTGIIAQYNGSFYLMPVSEAAFSNFVEQEKPDDVKVSTEKDALSINKTIVMAGDITLPTAGANFTDVAISWALAETANATLVGNVLTPVLPEEGEVKITLTATLTKGEETATKEIEVTIKALEPISIPAANDIAALQSHNTYTAEKYLVVGIVKEIQNSQYGNIVIEDAEGNSILVYGTYSADGSIRFDAIESKPAVGDTVKMYGVLGTFNGTNQMKNAWMLSWNHTLVVTVVAPTCKDAGYTSYDYLCACGGEDYTEAGEDALGHNYVENVCDRCGAENHVHSYEAVVTAPTCTAAGYTTYTCACSDSYTEAGDPAIAHVDADEDYKCDYNCGNNVLPAADTTITLAQAQKIAALFAHNTYTTDKYYVVVTINEVYNTQYGNLYVKDSTVEKFTVYGTYSADGSKKYDAMDSKPVAGDTVTLYGIIGTYNNAAQMKNAWITEISAHTCDYSVAATCTKGQSCAICGAVQEGSEPIDHSYSAATCQKLAECSVCGAKTGELAEHNMVDGECSVCGHKDGEEEAKIVTNADFDTVTKTNTSYVSSTTTDGWVATNCAILSGGSSDSNPVFKMFGSDTTTRAFCMNGKTSAIGSIVSPNLAGGVSSISLKYGIPFGDSKIKFTINIKQNGAVVASKVVEQTSAVKFTVYELEWNLDTVVEGDYTIEIVNNAPSNSTSNKDRTAIWDVQITGA